jgi:hypothetical protein
LFFFLCEETTFEMPFVQSPPPTYVPFLHNALSFQQEQQPQNFGASFFVPTAYGFPPSVTYEARYPALFTQTNVSGSSTFPSTLRKSTFPSPISPPQIVETSLESSLSSTSAISSPSSSLLRAHSSASIHATNKTSSHSVEKNTSRTSKVVAFPVVTSSSKYATSNTIAQQGHSFVQFPSSTAQSSLNANTTDTATVSTSPSQSSYGASSLPTKQTQQFISRSMQPSHVEFLPQQQQQQQAASENAAIFLGVTHASSSLVSFSSPPPPPLPQSNHAKKGPLSQQTRAAYEKNDTSFSQSFVGKYFVLSHFDEL